MNAPLLIAAFRGWNDAGDAASSALIELRRAWNGVEVLRIDGDEYFDFQVNRPHWIRDADDVRTLVWPSLGVFECTMPSGRRAYLVSSPEPSLQWRAFTTQILQIAERYGVEEIYTLGALLADVPHTRDLHTGISSNSLTLQERLGASPSEYEGPTGIVGVVNWAADEHGFDSASLWVSVPHYIAEPPNPKATLSLLATLSEAIDEPIDLTELREAAEEWTAETEDILQDSPEMQEYVVQLEAATDAATEADAAAESIAEEFERFLRDQSED